MLTVVAGQIVDDLRFSLVRLPAHEVSGVVTDEAGVPLAGIIVWLVSDPMEVGTATPATGQTDQDGAFRLGGIVSGSYHVRAAGGRPPVAAGGSPGSPGVAVVGGVFSSTQRRQSKSPSATQTSRDSGSWCRLAGNR
jgi:hypothetical protein